MEQLYEEYYKNLQSKWSEIFPDGNRNSGGVQFFIIYIKKWILQKKNLIYTINFIAVFQVP